MFGPTSRFYSTSTDLTLPDRRGVSTRNVIEEAKARVPTADLADLLCGPGKMRRIGDELIARCPLPDHEDRTPSFTVNPAKNLFYCHGCLRGGDVVELARLAWGHPKAEVATAAAMLLLEFGHEIPERSPSWFAKQERQKPVRDAINRARFAHLRRRLFRAFFAPSLARINDRREREVEAEILWDATKPLARLLVERLRDRSRVDVS